jgi:hypothetical protein
MLKSGGINISAIVYSLPKTKKELRYLLITITERTLFIPASRKDATKVVSGHQQQFVFDIHCSLLKSVGLGERSKNNWSPSPLTQVSQNITYNPNQNTKN